MEQSELDTLLPKDNNIKIDEFKSSKHLITKIVLLILSIGAIGLLFVSNKYVKKINLEDESTEFFWKLGDVRYNRNNVKIFPPSICWRQQYRTKNNEDVCKQGYSKVSNIFKKKCSQDCPPEWVTCGIRKGKGISCGQTKDDCKQAKKDMVLSIVGAGLDISGLIFTMGASAGVTTPTTKAAKVADFVFGWIEKIKDFKQTKGFKKLVNAIGAANDMYGTYSDGQGIVGSIQTVLTLEKSIRAMKGIPSKKKERREALKQLIITIGKMIGFNLLSLLDPTGLSGVAQAYTFPKCFNENYYWFRMNEEKDTWIEDDDDDESKPAIGDDRIPPALGKYDSPLTDDGKPLNNDDAKNKVVVSLDDDGATSNPTLAPTHFSSLIDGSGKVIQSKIANVGYLLSSLNNHEYPKCEHLKLISPLQRVKFTVTQLVHERVPLHGVPKVAGLGYWNWTCAYPVREKFVFLKYFGQMSTPRDDGTLIYLDRHSIYCPDGYFMTSFMPSTSVKYSNKFFFYYNCALYATTPYNPATDCRELNTGWNDPGKDMNYLDRHNIECSSDEALVGFNGKSNFASPSSPKFRIDYKCCKATVSYPTRRPIAPPTQAPTPQPYVYPPTPTPSASPTKYPSIFAPRPGGAVDTLSTRDESAGGNHIRELAKIGTVSCSRDKSPIKSIGFKSFNGHAGPMGYWQYSCAHVAEENFIQGSEKNFTGYPTQNGGIVYLDRQTIACPSGEYLSSFTPLNRLGDFQIDYKCMKFTASSNGYSNCRSLSTGFNDPGNSLRYLDRHYMECGPNEAITGFKGVTNSARQFQFSYTCCQGSPIYPTASPATLAPVTPPSAIPTAYPPTTKPTAEPSHEPTFMPTKEPTGPTLRPTLEPTMPPNWFPTFEPTYKPSLEPTSSS